MRRRLLCLFAPKDEEFLKDMDEHLSPLRRQDVLESWDQSRVAPGNVIEDEAEAKLKAADIVVPLVSASFMADDGCDQMWQRAADAGKLVVPLLVRPVYLAGSPLSRLKPLPSDGKPVADWTSRDGAWVDIVTALAARIRDWTPPMEVTPAVAAMPVKPRVPEPPPIVVPAEFVRIEPGTFWMGSPESEQGLQKDEKRHQVTLTRGFLLGKTPVTQEQYEAVMGNNPSKFKKSPRHPVEQVNWLDAVLYCNKRSEMEGLPPCYNIDGDQVRWLEGLSSRGYRLPTEAEWGYAARAGQATTYAGSDSIEEVAWYYSNSEDQTHPVGMKKANAWGLFDMSGNVWEWVWDWYGDYSVEPITDPIGPKSGQSRVYRGGSWFGVAFYARVASRDVDHPAYRYDDVGFRVARSLP